MSETLASFLEAGLGAFTSIISVVARARIVDEIFGLFHLVEHIFGIVLPVSCHVEQAVGNQYAVDKFEKFGFYYAAFVVALLLPWVGKEQLYTADTRGRHLVPQYLDSIMANHSQVFQSSLLCQVDEMADTGAMDFDTDKVLFGVPACLLEQGLTITETDFYRYRVVVIEYLFKIQWFWKVVDTVVSPVIIERTLLGLRQTALSQYVTLYPSLWSLCLELVVTQDVRDLNGLEECAFDG